MNKLNIPQKHFGKSGIQTGNLIYASLHKSNYHIKYDSNNKRIIVLRSSKISHEFIDKMLYKSDLSSKYDEWYPKLKKKRDSNGNLLIKFLELHPHQNNSSNYYKSKSGPEKKINPVLDKSLLCCPLERYFIRIK